MYRTLVLAFLVGASLSGCQALAEMDAQQRAQQQAAIDNLRARISTLTPDQKDAVQKCSSIAEGRVTALRNAGQGGATYGVNDFTIVDACLSNPYYYETIPAPAVVIQAPAPQPFQPQLIQPRQSINCTSQTMGTYTTTNCN